MSFDFAQDKKSFRFRRLVAVGIAVALAAEPTMAAMGNEPWAMGTSTRVARCPLPVAPSLFGSQMQTQAVVPRSWISLWRPRWSWAVGFRFLRPPLDPIARAAELSAKVSKFRQNIQALHDGIRQREQQLLSLGDVPKLHSPMPGIGVIEAQHILHRIALLGPAAPDRFTTRIEQAYAHSHIRALLYHDNIHTRDHEDPLRAVKVFLDFHYFVQLAAMSADIQNLFYPYLDIPEAQALVWPVIEDIESAWHDLSQSPAPEWPSHVVASLARGFPTLFVYGSSDFRDDETHYLRMQEFIDEILVPAEKARGLRGMEKPSVLISAAYAETGFHHIHWIRHYFEMGKLDPKESLEVNAMDFPSQALWVQRLLEELDLTQPGETDRSELRSKLFIGMAAWPERLRSVNGILAMLPSRASRYFSKIKHITKSDILNRLGRYETLLQKHGGSIADEALLQNSPVWTPLGVGIYLPQLIDSYFVLEHMFDKEPGVSLNGLPVGHKNLTPRDLHEAWVKLSGVETSVRDVMNLTRTFDHFFFEESVIGLNIRRTEKILRSFA